MNFGEDFSNRLTLASSHYRFAYASILLCVGSCVVTISRLFIDKLLDEFVNNTSFAVTMISDISCMINPTS